ncbi:hypothetical protein D3C81_1853590 [compost metagenome]
MFSWERVGRVTRTDLHNSLLTLHILDHLTVKLPDDYIRAGVNWDRDDRAAAFRLETLLQLLLIDNNGRNRLSALLTR